MMAMLTHLQADTINGAFMLSWCTVQTPKVWREEAAPPPLHWECCL